MTCHKRLINQPNQPIILNTSNSSAISSFKSNQINIVNNHFQQFNTSHLVVISNFKSQSIRWPSMLELQNIPTGYLYRGKTFPSKCLGYDTKQSDGEGSVMLELWGLRSTPSLTWFPGLLWSVVERSEKILSMGQIELNRVLALKGIVWN